MKLADKDDCTIVRDPKLSSLALLMDCDGEVVFSFDNTMTDEQIWTVLAYANAAFDRGYNRGRSDKAAEIRKVLEF